MCGENLRKTERAAKMIADGTGLGTVINISNGEPKMPRLDDGRHGAKMIVDGYKVEIINDMHELRRILDVLCITMLRTGEVQDIELNKFALAAEITVGNIQKYLQIKEAGCSLKEVADAH